MYTETLLLLLPVEILYIISSYCDIDERRRFSKVLSKFVDIPYHRKVYIPESLAAAIEKRPLPISIEETHNSSTTKVSIGVILNTFLEPFRTMLLTKNLFYTSDLTKVPTTSKKIPYDSFFSARNWRGNFEMYLIKSLDGNFYYDFDTGNPEWKPFDYPIQA